MVSSTGVKRIMCDPRVWSEVPGDSYSERIAKANLGVWKTLDDVPDRYRLSNFEAQYRDRDVMREFVDDYKPDCSEVQWTRKYRRVRRALDDHLDESHHALMTPAEVNSFFETRRSYSIRDQYQEYLGTVRTMYDWLMLRVDHPHRYNPVDMAMFDGGAVAEVVDEWMERKEVSE